MKESSFTCYILAADYHKYTEGETVPLSSACNANAVIALHGAVEDENGPFISAVKGKRTTVTRGSKM